LGFFWAGLSSQSAPRPAAHFFRARDPRQARPRPLRAPPGPVIGPQRTCQTYTSVHVVCHTQVSSTAPNPPRSSSNPTPLRKLGRRQTAVQRH
jgi:hypothetical protein